MEFLKGLIKALIILGTVLLMSAPFLLEYLTFKRDKEKKISYKRFRIVVFTLIYVIGVTVALYLLKEVALWLESLKLVKWITEKVSISSRIVYYGKIVVAMLLNLGVGVLFIVLSKFVRIGLKKKSLTVPKKKDGTFSWSQKLGRRVIKLFHTETWFFVGGVLKYLASALSAAYILIFVLYQLPAMYSADWIPYEFISMFFEAGYIYPSITLLALWQMYFFLQGIKRVEDECPELLFEEGGKTADVTVDLALIDEEVHKQFGDFYACAPDISKALQEELSSTKHSDITKFVAQAVENDKRNPQKSKEIYLDCMDKLSDSENSVLINGPFFSEFSMYFLRYLSVVVARGDNIVFVCNNESQIDSVYEYVREGLSELSSLYCKGFNSGAVNFDEPIWRIVRINGERDVLEEALVDDNSILITSLSYICSTHFESEHERFIQLLDTVVFVDALKTVNTYNRQLAMLNTRLKHITKSNALLSKNGNVNPTFSVRYMSKQVRYICFDDTRTPGLDKVLKNLLAVEFDSIDAMNYNRSTIVRCYNYEGKVNDNGRRSYPQYFDSEEEVGAIMNMAVLCLASGASSVTVFADDILPYANLQETIAANTGRLAIKTDGSNLRLNAACYNPDGYSVLIAMDSSGNLPAAMRRYISMMSDKPALVIIFSKPYMMREYYTSHIDGIWSSAQTERIPVEEGTRKDIAQKILVRANAGGISEAEILKLASGCEPFDEFAAKGNVNGVLRAVLDVYGLSHEEQMDLFRYFEYTSSQDFDENGIYNSEDKVMLRRQGKLFDMINGRDMVVMVTGDDEVTLPMPRSRLTQNYIAGQNLVYNGSIYHIQKINTSLGRIYARLAVGGKNNEAYRYIPKREYRVDVRDESTEAVFPTKHVVLKRETGGVSVSDVFVSVLRTPMEVLTSGYYSLDPHTLAVNFGGDGYVSISDVGNDLLAKQTYRRYGKIESPVYSTDSVMKETELVASEKCAQVLSLRICGQFGPDANKTMALAAVMLSETLKEMFPSVADSIAVCPVLHGELTDEDASQALALQPKLSLVGESELVSKSDFGLLIIEDSATDLGVVSVLMSAGDDILNTLFEQMFKYLKWYSESKIKSDYLYYGLGHEPSCFDFPSLYKLSSLLGDDKHDVRFVNLETVMQYDVCDFCGKRFPKGADIIELEDGRRMCKDCAANLVGNNKKALKSHLERAKIFLESTYGIVLDDDYEFCFESTVKIVNTLKQNRDLAGRGSDAPLKSYIDDKKKVHIEYSLPSVSLSELLVRELTHVWQIKHLPELENDLAEGHIALVAVQYLRFLNQDALASVRTTYYESTSNISGEGYRKLVSELLLKPQYNNNPFKYLLERTGTKIEDVIPPTPPRVIEEGDLGLPYTPEASDRSLDGSVTYFYYPRLPVNQAAAYDVMLTAIKAHEPSTTVSGCSFEDIVAVSDAIAFDHPELFWYNNFSKGGDTVNLKYGASAEESAAIQAKIDELAPKFLEGIDDSMSAYDVALRLHAKLISTVDYDTIALNKEKEAGGPKDDKIDYLRTICGVILNGKAVCEGYARALQYFLQKCGVECAEAAGYIIKDGGERGGAHAWNIVKIDGDYYYIDTTWDDSSNTVQAVKDTDMGFNYFCITTEELCRTRDTSLNPIEMPICTATKANYFYHNDFVLEAYDLAKIKVIAQLAARGGRQSFTVKCKTQAIFDATVEELCNKGGDCYEALKSAAKADKKISTDGYRYSSKKQTRTVTIYFKYK